MTTALPDGTMIGHHDKVDIKQALCKENERKCQLVHQTPIANSPSKEDFGLDGLTQKTINTAEGTYTAPATVDKGIQQWTQLMGRNQQAKSDNNSTQRMTMQEFRTGWKKAKEKTGSNTCGPGHSECKAMAMMML